MSFALGQVRTAMKFTIFLLAVSSSVTLAGPRSCEVAYEVVALQSAEGREMRRTMASGEAKEYGIPTNDPRYLQRNLLVATMKSPERRRDLRKATLADMKMESRALDRRLGAAAEKKAKEPEFLDEASQVYDIISIGAGVHDTIAQLEIAQRDPSLKTLTVEGSQDVAGVFAKDGFNMNSPTGTSRVDQLPVPKKGRNLNEIAGGLVQVSDFAGGKYTNALDFADVVLQNRRAASKAKGRAEGSAPILFGRTIAKVEDRNLSSDPKANAWPKRYRATLDNGVQIFTSAIANSTGSGREPKLDKFDVESQVLINRERQQKDELKPPGIQTADEYFNHLYENPEAFGNYAGESIAIIGPGNSSDTAIESLLGFGPGSSYGKVGASAGRAAKIVWFGQSKTTCDSFLNGVRNRYADIASGYKNGTIEAAPKGATRIEKLADGKYRISDGSGNSKVVDRVILGVGFKEDVAEMYQPITRATQNGDAFNEKNLFRESGYLEKVQDRILEKGEVDVAKRLKNPRGSMGQTPAQAIFFYGPSAGKLAKPQELAGVDENYVSIFLTGPRTQAGTQVMVEAAQKEKEKELERMPEEARIPMLTKAKLSGAPIVPILRNKTPMTGRSESSEALLRTRLIALLDRFEWPNNQVNLRFTRVGKNAFALTSQPGLSNSSAKLLAEKIQEDPSLVVLIESRIGEGQKKRELIVSLDASKEKSINLLHPDKLSIKERVESIAKFDEKNQVEVSDPQVDFTKKAPPSKPKITGAALNAGQSVALTYGYNVPYVRRETQDGKGYTIERKSRVDFPQGKVNSPVKEIDMLVDSEGELITKNAESMVALLSSGEEAYREMAFQAWKRLPEGESLRTLRLFRMVRTGISNTDSLNTQKRLLNSLDVEKLSAKERRGIQELGNSSILPELVRGSSDTSTVAAAPSENAAPSQSVANFVSALSRGLEGGNLSREEAADQRSGAKEILEVLNSAKGPELAALEKRFLGLAVLRGFDQIEYLRRTKLFRILTQELDEPNTDKVLDQIKQKLTAGGVSSNFFALALQERINFIKSAQKSNYRGPLDLPGNEVIKNARANLVTKAPSPLRDRLLVESLVGTEGTFRSEGLGEPTKEALKGIIDALPDIKNLELRNKAFVELSALSKSGIFKGTVVEGAIEGSLRQLIARKAVPVSPVEKFDAVLRRSLVLGKVTPEQAADQRAAAKEILEALESAQGPELEALEKSLISILDIRSFYAAEKLERTNLFRILTQELDGPNINQSIIKIMNKNTTDKTVSRFFTLVEQERKRFINSSQSSSYRSRNFPANDLVVNARIQFLLKAPSPLRDRLLVDSLVSAQLAFREEKLFEPAKEALKGIIEGIPEIKDPELRTEAINELTVLSKSDKFKGTALGGAIEASLRQLIGSKAVADSLNVQGLKVENAVRTILAKKPTNIREQLTQEDAANELLTLLDTVEPTQLAILAKRLTQQAQIPIGNDLAYEGNRLYRLLVDQLDEVGTDRQLKSLSLKLQKFEGDQELDPVANFFNLAVKRRKKLIDNTLIEGDITFRGISPLIANSNIQLLALERSTLRDRLLVDVLAQASQAAQDVKLARDIRNDLAQLIDVAGQTPYPAQRQRLKPILESLGRSNQFKFTPVEAAVQNALSLYGQ